MLIFHVQTFTCLYTLRAMVRNSEDWRPALALQCESTEAATWRLSSAENWGVESISLCVLRICAPLMMHSIVRLCEMTRAARVVTEREPLHAIPAGYLELTRRCHDAMEISCETKSHFDPSPRLAHCLLGVSAWLG